MEGGREGGREGGTERARGSNFEMKGSLWNKTITLTPYPPDVN